MFVQKGFKPTFDKYSDKEEAKGILDYLKVVDQIRKAESDAALIDLITANDGFSIEYCPINFLKNHEVIISNISIDTLILFTNFDTIKGLDGFDSSDEHRKFAVKLESYVKIETFPSAPHHSRSCEAFQPARRRGDRYSSHFCIRGSKAVRRSP